ncbi:hypothetical protein NST07_05900 [Paenibacillus sp. FSL L8-0340]|uniref:hypothetical protein n=1 Tax=Paenibacillus sp. FSL L8-0340 TaxID=2954685 RepID=UPI0031580153
MLIVLMYMFAALGAGLLLAAAVLRHKLSDPSSDLNKLIHTLADFNLKFSKRFITPDKSHIIALDEGGKQLAIGMYSPDNHETSSAALYTFDVILGSEIVENALTLTKVSKTSRITSSGAKTGTGKVLDAAAVDGTTNRQEDGKPEEIIELTLKIYLSSTDTPVLSIPFLPRQVPANKSDPGYSQALMEVQHVHEMIRDIVSA